VYRVSKATGISATTFTDWKNGRSMPKADKLKRVADHFDIKSKIPSGTTVICEFKLKKDT
jgi:transcriptional regulator with XRE-family HTH domain